MPKSRPPDRASAALWTTCIDALPDGSLGRELSGCLYHWYRLLRQARYGERPLRASHDGIDNIDACSGRGSHLSRFAEPTFIISLPSQHGAEPAPSTGFGDPSQQQEAVAVDATLTPSQRDICFLRCAMAAAIASLYAIPHCFDHCRIKNDSRYAQTTLRYPSTSPRTSLLD